MKTETKNLIDSVYNDAMAVLEKHGIKDGGIYFVNDGLIHVIELQGEEKDKWVTQLTDSCIKTSKEIFHL